MAPVTEFPVKTVLRVARPQSRRRPTKPEALSLLPPVRQTLSAPDKAGIRCSRSSAGRTSSRDRRILAIFSWCAPISPASTRNNQCNSPSTSASVSTVRRTGIKAVASGDRSTARRNAQMAARRRSHRSVPLIQRIWRALELRSTPARHPGPASSRSARRCRPARCSTQPPVLQPLRAFIPCPPLLSAVPP